MSNKGSSIPFEKGLAGAAIASILLGLVLLVVVDCKAFGWIALIYGVLALFLAYHVGTAPYSEEPESGELVLRPDEQEGDLPEGSGEIQPERVPE